jgi:hypothetical protein
MPKWVYPLSFLFLLFVIYNDPAGAGNMAHAFAEFVGAIISTFGEFLSGLFGDSQTNVQSTAELQSNTNLNVEVNPDVRVHPDVGVHPNVHVHPDVTAPAAPTTDAFGHGHYHGYDG